MSNSKLLCILCHGTEDNELKYGEFKSKAEYDFSVHYYCLYLTSNLVQRGQHVDGISGFLISDIKKEARKILINKCYICRKMSANITCCHKKCEKTFHTKCAIEAGCTMQFRGNCKSYCEKHQKFGTNIVKPKETDICTICYSELGCFQRDMIFPAPCCQGGWFHRWCLAKLALSSGYLFKCPLCNNNKKFRYGLSGIGIFIPNRDPAWEVQPNAYAELLERPNICTAKICICPLGRMYKRHLSYFDFINCTLCGSKAQHRRCITMSNIGYQKRFTCDECKEFNENINKENESNRINTSNENGNNMNNNVCTANPCETPVKDIDDVDDDKDKSPNENCLDNKEEVKENEENKAEDSNQPSTSNESLTINRNNTSPNLFIQKKLKMTLILTESASPGEFIPQQYIIQTNSSSIDLSNDCCASVSNESLNLSNGNGNNNSENSLLSNNNIDNKEGEDHLEKDDSQLTGELNDTE